MRRTFFEVDAAPCHLEHADVRVVGGAIVVVLFVAGFGALAAAVTDREVERVAKLYPRGGTYVAEVHLGAIAAFGVCLEAREHFLQIGFGEGVVVLLQEAVEVDLAGELGEWCGGAGKGGGAEGDPCCFQCSSACDSAHSTSFQRLSWPLV